MASPRELALNDLHERMRAAGLRVTRPRVSVYQVLSELAGHHAAEEIVQTLQKRGVRMSRASVFNVLHDLSTAGLIMRADAGPGRALYEATDAWHHHFVCRQCGAIHDVPCSRGVKPCLQPDLPQGFNIDEAQIIFRGLCPKCA